MTKNTAVVKILGQTYTICSDESAADMVRLAAKVSEDIGESIRKSSSAGALTAAALVAMDYLCEAEKAKKELSRAASESGVRSDEIERQSDELESLKEELSRLKEELSRARAEATEYQARVVVLEDKLERARKKGAKKSEREQA